MASQKEIFSIVFQVLLFVFCPGTAAGQPVQGEKANPLELHGGIEIGPRVVQAIALRLTSSDEGYNVRVVYSESAVPTANYLQDGRLTPEYIEDVGQIVQRLSEKLQKEHRVPPNQIYLIGLSDLAPLNPADLEREIRNRTGKTLNFLNTDAEVQLSIAGIIPRRYKSANRWYDNRSISSLIDIGNTSTKGGYQQLKQTSAGRADYDYVTWEVPRGVVNFLGEVSKTAGENVDYTTFARRAETLSNTSYRGFIKAEATRKPGLLTRKKVYLTGGIVSAMVSLLHPDDQRSYIPITVEEIDTFYRRAVTDPESLLNPDLSKMTDDKLRNEARKTRETIKQSFSPKTLIAGAELLRTIATELNLQDKTMVYARYSYLARIMSYVRLQPE